MIYIHSIPGILLFVNQSFCAVRVLWETDNIFYSNTEIIHFNAFEFGEQAKHVYLFLPPFVQLSGQGGGGGHRAWGSPLPARARPGVPGPPSSGGGRVSVSRHQRPGDGDQRSGVASGAV